MTAVQEAAQNGFEFAKIITPVATACLAAFLALLANRHLERLKAGRDATKGVADGLRADVRAAVEVAAAYWSDPTKDKHLNEARLKMLEQEIRATALVVDKRTSDKSAEFQSAVTSFIGVLTGADFEAADVVPNKGHIRDIVGRGVALRKLTAELSRDQVERA